MKTNLTRFITALLIAGSIITASSCNKNVNNININTGTNGLDSNGNPTNNPTTDSFMYVTGTINGKELVDGTAYSGIIGSTTVILKWKLMPSQYQQVSIKITLNDGATNQTSLLPSPMNIVTSDNTYNALIASNDYRFNNDHPARLNITFTPLKGSGKKGVTYSVILKR